MYVAWFRGCSLIVVGGSVVVSKLVMRIRQCSAFCTIAESGDLHLLVLVCTP